MNTKQEQIKKLTEGRDPHLIKWLSLEDWDTLPSESLLDEINEAWHTYAGDTDGFTRYVRHLLNEDTAAANEVYDNLIRDPEARRKIVAYEFTEYDDGEHGFVKALEDKYDVHGQVIYDAMSEIRLQLRRNF